MLDVNSWAAERSSAMTSLTAAEELSAVDSQWETV